MRGSGILTVIHKGPNNIAVIERATEKMKTWRHTVDLDKKECSCRRWQITGLPCTHALASSPLAVLETQKTVDDYYSVERFKKAYEGTVMPMTDRSQWPKVELGFKIWPPVLKRSAGRPRSRRIKSVQGGGKKVTRQMQCKRCGQFDHMMKTCNETV